MHCIQISRPLAIHMLALAQQSPAQEVCGLIGAKDGKPSTVYPIRNIASNPVCSFAMDPQEQIHALKSMRNKDEILFAVYHSHPSSPAQPSAEDLANIGYPDVYQLIVSLSTKGVLEMRAYQLGPDGLIETELAL